jgi:CDP-glucose 4,6-dehydratase
MPDQAFWQDGCYRGQGPFREDDPLGGDDRYSASKAAQEHVAAAYRGLGLPIATVRAGNVIGSGDWAPDRLVADCMRAALSGEPLTVRAPESVRPWQHVLCPLDGYLTVAQRLCGGEPGVAWNFGPAEEHSVASVVERLRERWPGPLDVRAAEPDAARGESPVLRLDSTRARERLGWAPRWDLDAALDATVGWYAAYRDGADMRAETLRQIGRYAVGELTCEHASHDASAHGSLSRCPRPSRSAISTTTSTQVSPDAPPRLKSASRSCCAGRLRGWPPGPRWRNG